MARSKGKPKGKPRPKKPKRGRPVKGTEDWAPAFLQAITDGMHVRDAAAHAKVSGRKPYERRGNDEAFRVAWEQASKIGTQALEDEAARRAFHGTKKPVYQGGVLVGHIQEYSDTLIQFLLRARRPKRYREKTSIEHSGPGGKPMQFQHVRDLSDDELTNIASPSRNGTALPTPGATESDPVH